MRYVGGFFILGALRSIRLICIMGLLAGCKLSLIGPTGTASSRSAGGGSVSLAQVAPDGANDVLIVNRNAAATPALVLANDTDANGDTLTVATVTQGTHGTVSIGAGSASVTYTPDPGYYGIDSFDYTVSDGRGGGDTASVTVKVMTPFTWTGGGGNDDWRTAGNWYSGAMPDNTQTAVFDATCSTNCSATMYVDTDVFGIEMNTGYNGSVSKISGAPFPRLEVSAFTIRSGTFNGGDFLVDIEGRFIQSGGVFNAPTNEQLRVHHYGGVDYTFWDWSGGTFNHNNGWVTLSGAINGCGAGELRIDTHAQQLNLNDLRWNSVGCGPGMHTRFVLVFGTDILVTRDFYDNIDEGEGLWGGLIRVRRNVIKTIPTGTTNREQCGDTRLVLDGTGAQTISSTTQYSCLHHLEINKPSGSVSAALGTTAWGANAFRLIAGSFTAPSTSFRIFDSSAGVIPVFTIEAGQAGNYSQPAGTLDFTTTGSAGGFTDIKGIELNGQTLTVANVNFDMAGEPADTLRIPTGTLRVTGNMTVESGRVDGIIEVGGDLNLMAGATGGTASITMNGASDRNLTVTGAMPTGTFTIAKAVANQLDLLTPLTLGAAGQDLVITSGHFNLNGNNLTVSDRIDQTGGNLVMVGTETISKGSYNPTGNAFAYYLGNVTGLALGDAYLGLRIFGNVTLAAPLTVTSMVISTGGSLNAAGHAISVLSDWTQNNNFSPAGNTVTFSGSGPHGINASTTFFNLTRNGGGNLFFGNGITVTVTNNLDLQGAVGLPLNLRSYTLGAAFTLDPQGGRSFQYLNVRDSVCLGAACAAGGTSTDATGNTNWTF
ncbi:MAG TPA: Ig-like domain-containing protein [Bdellovibrionota bacterium]|nr:Ig-like domain-containing protein [Bdellovibrionota bacterium]